MIALGFDGLVLSSPKKEGFELQLNTEQRSLVVAGCGGRGGEQGAWHSCLL